MSFLDFIIAALVQNGFYHSGTIIHNDVYNFFPRDNRVVEFTLISSLGSPFTVIFVYADGRVDKVEDIKACELLPLLIDELNENRVIKLPNLH